MHNRRGVDNHQVRSYQPGNLERGGVPPQKPDGNWLSRKLKAWKGQATDFLRNHGVLPNKPIHRRNVDEAPPPHHVVVIEDDAPEAPLPITPERPPVQIPQPPSHRRHTQALHQGRRQPRRRLHNGQQQQSRVHQYLLEKPCEFALRCIDEERPIPANFAKDALKPGLQMAWGKIAGISPQRADRMTDLLVHSFGIQGLDIDEEFLDSYENNSRYAPLSPAQKFNLILSLNEQLKTPEVQRNFSKILDALDYYRNILGPQELPGDEKQMMMENLAEYLINHADNLPALTSKGLAACAHFSKYIESVQYKVEDVPAEMSRFMDFMSDNPESFTSMTSSGIAASYIFSAEFEDQKEHLPHDVMRPFSSDDE